MTQNKIILLSIKPKWFELIKAGKKTVEIRRRFCNVNINDELYFYVSSPVKKILGKMTNCISSYYNYIDPNILSREEACLSYDEAKAYLDGCEEYCAIYLNEMQELDLRLSDLGLSRPPQNYCYLRR